MIFEFVAFLYSFSIYNISFAKVAMPCKLLAKSSLIDLTLTFEILII